MPSLQYALEEAAYRLAALRHGFVPRGARRILLVNGSPKTGTTWMQMMLASLPGYRRGGNFKGRIARYLSAQPGQVIHGHDPLTAELQGYLQRMNIGVILMVRDPRDQIVSRMFHVRRDAKHAWHQPFQSMSDDDALLACIEGRHAHTLPGIATLTALTQSWLAVPASARLVRYEDLHTDALAQMQAVLQHLQIAVSPALLKAVIARNRFDRLTVGRNLFQRGRQPGEADAASHFRKGITGDWRNHFKPQHIQRFKELAGDTLIAWGYETDCDW
jgi:hypothetical protein